MAPYCICTRVRYSRNFDRLGRRTTWQKNKLQPSLLLYQPSLVHTPLVLNLLRSIMVEKTLTPSLDHSAVSRVVRLPLLLLLSATPRTRIRNGAEKICFCNSAYCPDHALWVSAQLIKRLVKSERGQFNSFEYRTSAVEGCTVISVSPHTINFSFSSTREVFFFLSSLLETGIVDG